MDIADDAVNKSDMRAGRSGWYRLWKINELRFIAGLRTSDTGLDGHSWQRIPSTTAKIYCWSIRDGQGILSPRNVQFHKSVAVLNFVYLYVKSDERE